MGQLGHTHILAELRRKAKKKAIAHNLPCVSLSLFFKCASFLLTRWVVSDSHCNIRFHVCLCTERKRKTPFSKGIKIEMQCPPRVVHPSTLLSLPNVCLVWFLPRSKKDADEDDGQLNFSDVGFTSIRHSCSKTVSSLSAFKRRIWRQLWNFLSSLPSSMCVCWAYGSMNGGGSIVNRCQSMTPSSQIF